MKSDLEIAQQSHMKKITDVAEQIGLGQKDIEQYGPYKAKISLEAVKSNRFNAKGKVILVTAINPTPAGEGKSTTTIGLGDALSLLGHQSMIALREPSLGPVMGVKGGAAGGGYSQVLPMEDINLHFTGDIHAITSANNLISAVIDNHLYRKNKLNVDPEEIIWHRVMDMNDRALRKIKVGLNSKREVAREDSFDITVASELMAVLCLAKDLDDLKRRVGRIIVAYDKDARPLTVDDFKVSGAVTMLLKDAIKPNLVQTIEHTPVLIHGGPFANIAHGCNSIMATDFARRAADYAVTEAGFGADLGMEKFIDIKARNMGVMPSAVVIVLSIRALKNHGGVGKKHLEEENLEALKKGIENLEKHIDSVNQYDLPYVVALNRFSSDTKKEIDWIMDWAQENNHPIALSEVFAKGGKGGIELAKQVIALTDESSDHKPKFLYDENMGIKEKIETIAERIYGADGVDFSDEALKQIESFEKEGWDNLPICMAKTPLSLSDDSKKKGRPKGFNITVRSLKPSIGAGFIVVLTGKVMTMPGLPSHGAYENMDVIDDEIVGLF